MVVREAVTGVKIFKLILDGLHEIACSRTPNLHTSPTFVLKYTNETAEKLSRVVQSHYPPSAYRPLIRVWPSVTQFTTTTCTCPAALFNKTGRVLTG
jgi:hypothetical protein